MPLVLVRAGVEAGSDNLPHSIGISHARSKISFASLPAAELDMPGGSYDLILEDGVVLACRDQRVFPLGDRPVTVEVVSVPED